MKHLLTALFFGISCALLSQNDSSANQHRHELGIETTGFIRQFLRSDNGGAVALYYPVTPYLFTYRYQIGPSNIRLGIGGSYTQASVPGYSINGAEQIFKNTTLSGSARVGYEWLSTLTKHWQCYYGVDVHFKKEIQNNQAQYSNAGYLYGYNTNSNTLGMGPLLGFRYNFNKRISLLTEGNFTFFIRNKSNQVTSKSLDILQNPEKPILAPTLTKDYYGSFAPPLALYLSIKL